MIITKIPGGHWSGVLRLVRPWYCNLSNTIMKKWLQQNRNKEDLLPAGRAGGETNISFAKSSKIIDEVS